VENGSSQTDGEESSRSAREEAVLTVSVNRPASTTSPASFFSILCAAAKPAVRAIQQAAGCVFNHPLETIVAGTIALAGVANAAWIFEGKVKNAPTGAYAQLFNGTNQIGDPRDLDENGRYYFYASSGLFAEDDTAIIKVYDSSGQSLGETHLSGNLRPNSPVNYPTTISAGAQSNVTAYGLTDIRGRDGDFEVITSVNNGKFALYDTINEHPPQGSLEPYVSELSVGLPKGTENFQSYFIKPVAGQPGCCWADSTGWMQVDGNDGFGPNVENIVAGAYDTYDVWFDGKIPIPQLGVREEPGYRVQSERLPVLQSVRRLREFLQDNPGAEVYDATGSRISEPTSGTNFIRLRPGKGASIVKVIGI